MIPPKFIASLVDVLGGETSQLVEALDNSLPSVSVRYNPCKTVSIPDNLCEVPWNRYGRYLENRPYFTADPCFQSGQYYVQEASSMFVEHLYRQSVGDDVKGVRLLDLCAAPGGKTTIYSTLVGTEGLVVANETVRKRAMVLSDNVNRWGIGNVVVTNNETSHFSSLPEWFDVVAVDAPCSGEGMFRKDMWAREEWSEENVSMCALRQRRILDDVWCALKPGGVLIYSTCTFNRKENEENVGWLVDNYDCEPVDIVLSEQWNIERSCVKNIDCFRFYPHKIRGEGFFATVLRKGQAKMLSKLPKARRNPFVVPVKQQLAELSRWVADASTMTFRQVGDNFYGYHAGTFADIKSVCEQLAVVHSGVCMGQIFGQTLRPDHSLALFCGVSREYGVDVDLDVAQSFLSRGNVPCALFREGMNLLVYSGLPVGWGKRVSNRVNSLLPKQFSINNLQNE